MPLKARPPYFADLIDEDQWFQDGLDGTDVDFGTDHVISEPSKFKLKYRMENGELKDVEDVWQSSMKNQNQR